jgi:DNA-binding SARP family transcriptional activator
VLARLLVAGGVVVSADMLIDDIYGGVLPASGLATLHSYISNLRRALEPDRAPRTPARLLVARAPGYALVSGQVDAVRFTRLIAAAETQPPAQALASVEEALRLWRGVP